MQANKPKSIFDIYLNLCTYFSGASPSLIKKIPADDRKAYSWIGIYNLLISFALWYIIVRYCTRELYSILYSDNIAIVAGVSLVFVFIMQFSITRKMINQWSTTAQFFYFFWGGIIGLFFILSLRELVTYNGLVQSIFLALNALAVILFYILTFLVIKQSQKDFYHQLLEEKEKLNTEMLRAQRQKIIDDFKIQNEITQTKNALNVLNKEDNANKEEIEKILTGLENDKPSTALMTLADVNFNNSNFDDALNYINKAIELAQEGANKNDRSIDPELYEIKARILKSLSLFEDAENTEKLAIKIRSENAFFKNKGKQILLDNLGLENVSIFDNFSWQFKPGINILLGKNGYGKSHLLGLMIALLYDDKTKIKDWITASDTNASARLNLKGDLPGYEKEDELRKKIKNIALLQEEIETRIDHYNKSVNNKDEKPASVVFQDDIETLNKQNRDIIALQAEISALRPTIAADSNTITTKTGRIPILAIPDSRFINKSESSIESINTEHKDLAQFGAFEFLYNLPYAQVIKNSLFEASLDHIGNKRSFDIQPFRLIREVIRDLSSDKLITINDKIVYQDESRFEFVSIEHSSKEGTFQIQVKPEDSEQVLPLQKISQGTFSVIAICCVVHNFLKSIYGNPEDIYQKHAIIIIDELDAHIHPSWQNKLIGIFREHFPNVQFIISAHSPLLIKGCRAGEASVLRRSNRGKFKIQTINQPLFGLSVDELHTLIFEIESTDAEMLRYKEIAVYKDKYLEELRSLVEEDEINPSLKNTTRINELQEKINYISIAEKSYDVKKEQKNDEMNVIMNFQHTAVKNDVAEIKITDLMIPRSRMIAMVMKDDDKFPEFRLKDCLDFLAANKVSRLIILDESNRIKYVIHKDIIATFIADQFSLGNAPFDYTLKDMHERGSAVVKEALSNPIKLVSENSNFRETKDIMGKGIKCQDVFLTKNAQPGEAVIGWITDDVLSANLYPSPLS